jgi:hypothetical protein
MILRKAARLVSRPIELSACATSGAWTVSAIGSRNTAMTAGSLISRTSFAPKEASTCTRVSRSRSTGRSAGTSSRLARSLMQEVRISCLLPSGLLNFLNLVILIHNSRCRRAKTALAECANILAKRATGRGLWENSDVPRAVGDLEVKFQRLPTNSSFGAPGERSARTSRIGGWPKKRLYSRLNCVALS